jgi:hypothetical protein
MKALYLIIIVALSLSLARFSPAQTPAPSSGGSNAPYTEGPVWDVTFVRTKPGMADDYLKNLAGAYKATSEEAKKQGIIVDYRILIGDAANRDDFDIMLMVEYKNMAAFDGLREKTDPIARKLIGGEDVMRQANVKRLEIREILGTKTMREVTLK